MQKRTTKRASGTRLRPGRWALAAVLFAVGGYAAWRYLGSQGVARQEAPQQIMSAAPVQVASVEKRDVPIFLNGLGTVQATNSVTVRSRVDGQIEKVAFEEGQIVHQGDLLVQIAADRTR